MKTIRLTVGTAVLGLTAVLAFSCRSANKGLPYDDPENAPVQAVYNSVSAFTDSGRVQMTMESPLMYNYSDEKGTQIFPTGVHSIFLNEFGETNVDLVSDSAINIQDDRMMKFYGNVVVKDYRNGDTLYTEALYWNQQTRKIYSDVHVRKVSPGLILEGDGFDSDEEMNDVRLRRPRGVIL
ncbi:MAG: LPS export ABC transporter periplasmic protein LptC [Bacteroidales bacterium]|nr:LPS export ABC transporter periplasmic protein LptC [Bacteroidales bacterium]